MKMLKITKNILSYRFDWLLSQITLNALKYEAPMFQEFRTQNDTCLFDIHFISCSGLCEYFIYFKITIFSQSIVSCQCFLFPMQIFDFKKSIITIKLWF